MLPAGWAPCSCTRPGPVFALLFVVMLVCSLMSGYRLGSSSSWTGLHRAAFLLILTITYFVIADLEYPRKGLIRVDEIDQMLVQVRQSM
jgi:hypothetical protein